MAERKKRHWLSRLSFGSVCLLASALLVLAYVSVIVDPAKAWFFTFFGLLYPPVLVLTFGLFVWALIRRSTMRGLLLAVLLPSFFFAGRYYQPHWKTLEGEPTLKVLSYNVGLFAHSDGTQDRLALADSVCAFMHRDPGFVDSSDICHEVKKRSVCGFCRKIAELFEFFGMDICDGNLFFVFIEGCFVRGFNDFTEITIDNDK